MRVNGPFSDCRQDRFEVLSACFFYVVVVGLYPFEICSLQFLVRYGMYGLLG